MLSFFFRRRKILRGTKAGLDQFTGLEGELGYQTDTNQVVVFDGENAGGTIIGNPAPQLVAQLSGENESTSNYRNWDYLAGLLQPDVDGYLDFKPGIYSVQADSGLIPGFNPSVILEGDHTAAFAAETFRPALVAEKKPGIGLAYGADSSQLYRTNGFDILKFTATAYSGGSDTTGCNDAILSASLRQFVVLEQTKLRFAYADTLGTVTANANLGGTILRIYGPEQ
jgi:hypothetical protein